jgi:hypothetical protein
MIDSHTHILPNKPNKLIEEFGEEKVLLEMFSNEQKATTPEELLKSMNLSNIKKSIILGYGWTNFNLLQASNKFNLDAFKKNSSKLIPFFSINPMFKENLQEMEKCINLGGKGAGEIHPSIQELAMDNENIWKDSLKLLEENSLPIIIHASEPAGHLYPGKGNTYPENIYKFIKLFPGNTIILAHWGGGLLFYELMKEVKEISKNVYYDTAASSFLYNPKIFEIAIEIVGSEKIIFGSDFPILSPNRILEEMKNLKEQDLMNITEKNIKSILNLN